MTLHQIVDDILLTINSIDPKKVESLEVRQVEYWVDLYRLILLRQDINDNSIIDPSYVSYLDILMTHANREYTFFSKGQKTYVSDDQLPKFPVLTGRFALLTVTKPFNAAVPESPINPHGGLLIPVHDWSRFRYMHLDRWSNKSVTRASIKDKYLYVYMQYDPEYVDSYLDSIMVQCGMILCNPANYYQKDTFTSIPFRDLEYPLPDEKIPRLKQMIFANELQWVLPPQATMQSAQMAKMEEKDMSNNPAVTLQQGADLYEGE